jgi:hypothetical protein
MRIATVIFIVLSCTLTICGLFPCLGFINWIGIPCSGICALLGLVGTVSKDTPEADKGTHLVGLILGVSLMGVGAIRCFLGGGVV